MILIWFGGGTKCSDHNVIWTLAWTEIYFTQIPYAWRKVENPSNVTTRLTERSGNLKINKCNCFRHVRTEFGRVIWYLDCESTQWTWFESVLEIQSPVAFRDTQRCYYIWGNFPLKKLHFWQLLQKYGFFHHIFFVF